MPPKPRVRALLLSDFAIQDPTTGKYTLHGIFDRIAASSFPATHGGFAVYVRMTDLNGRYDLRVHVVAQDLQTITGEPSDPLSIVCSDPLSLVETALNLKVLALPEPGRYAVRLTYNGLIAEETTLTVERAWP